MRKSPKKILPGMVYGRLTVVRKGEDYINPKSGKIKSRYWCQCSCGSPEKLIVGAALNDGSIQSCGCLHKETSSQNMKEYRQTIKNMNEYEIGTNCVIGYTSNNHQPFYFDKDDFDAIKDIYWQDSMKGYITGHIPGSELRQHTFIMNPFSGFVVDHKNGDSFDNRKCNLRNTLQIFNTKNKLRPKNEDGSIKIDGIKQTKNGYEVRITCNHSVLAIGCYPTEEEAIFQRFKCEVELYGEYSTRDDGEYSDVKKKVLQLFKPVHYITLLNKEDFINWGNQKCLYDEEAQSFVYDVESDTNYLTMVDYYKKYSRMEVFYKYADDYVVFGYFGLVLKDPKDSCLLHIIDGDIRTIA